MTYVTFGAGLKPAPFASERQPFPESQPMSWFQRAAALLAVVSLVLPAPAMAQRKPGKSGPALIRDAEIEGLLRNMTRPIFKAAGINAAAVKVYVIADDQINAFVAGGQRIFIHTGLITKAKTPNEVIGVMAHESGHIAGGHLARLNSELDQASTERIIGMLIGAAAIVGGAAAGVDGATKAGSGIMAGSQGIAQRNLLAYQRSMEASADQAALKYLQATRQSPEGMLTLFQQLANNSLASLDRADPYLFSHPMPFDRIRTLEQEAKLSPYYGKADDPGMILRLKLAKAKLSGFLDTPQRVFQKYPSTDKSLAGRYARSIAMFRRGDIRNALPLIESLTAELPENPYFWELKAQALMENGQATKGLPAIRKARELLPNNGLLTHLHAALLLSTDNAAIADEALKLLRLARKSEPDMPVIHKDLARAYALKGDAARADLAAAEFAWSTGDVDLALKKAKLAQERFKRGTPEWLRANDLVTFASGKKG
jgi:predicted Zn-dependent protease